MEDAVIAVLQNFALSQLVYNWFNASLYYFIILFAAFDYVHCKPFGKNIFIRKSTCEN